MKLFRTLLLLRLLGLLGLLGSNVLLDTSSAGSTGLLVQLGVLLLQGLEELLVPRDGRLRVVLVEDLAGPVSAGALGDAELVALEVGRGSEGRLGRDLLAAAGGGVLLEGLLLRQRGREGLGGGVAVEGNVELQGLDVVHRLDVAPHLLVLGVLHQHAVGVDDVRDHGDLVGAGTAEDADEAANAHVVRVHHFWK